MEHCPIVCVSVGRALGKRGLGDPGVQGVQGEEGIQRGEFWGGGAGGAVRFVGVHPFVDDTPDFDKHDVLSF